MTVIQERPKTQAEVALHDYKITKIVNRDDTNASPPTGFIAKAKHSVLITGFSAFRTVENNPDTMQRLLDDGVQVYMLIVDPSSSDIPVQESLDPGMPVRQNYATAMKIVKSRYSAHQNFHLRYMTNLPPITGIVIDAEIEGKSTRLRSRDASMRIQIRGLRIPQRRGFIIEMNQSEGEDNALFNLYWDDFRAQWKEARPHPVAPALEFGQ